MRYIIASTLAIAAIASASPMPQADTSASGCSPDYSGEFQIQVVNVTSSAKRSTEKRQAADGTLLITLEGGVLKDSQDRTGSIVANHQFQFDSPVQDDALYTSGWSVCSNGSLAIDGDALFYQCLSGTFYNLYDEAEAAQCTPVYINVIGAGSASSSVSGAASTIGDGQLTASAAPSAYSVSQISDGQIQVSTSASAAPVTQISDGQVQASTSAAAAPVSQISDGQIQASTSAAAAPVSQISDGQIQVSTSAAAAPVTQISDGQIQVQTSTAAAPVTQISDGQIQAPVANGTYPSGTGVISAPSGTGSPIASYTGAANKVSAAGAGLLAVLGLVAAL